MRRCRSSRIFSGNGPYSCVVPCAHVPLAKVIVTKTYLLIDLQNRQPAPERVAAWMGSAGETWIFYGDHEIKLLPKYWELGEQVSIVPISKPGKNSLDFHLVLYLGYLIARRERGARFVVVAGDADYDPAICHAQSRGVDVVRVPGLMIEEPTTDQNIAAAPPDAKRTTIRLPQAGEATPAKAVVPAPSRPTKTTIAVYAGILRDIKGPNRPGDLKALTSRIQSRIGHQPAPEKVADVIARLETMDAIKIVDGELTYLVNPDQKAEGLGAAK